MITCSAQSHSESQLVSVRASRYYPDQPPVSHSHSQQFHCQYVMTHVRMTCHNYHRYNYKLRGYAYKFPRDSDSTNVTNTRYSAYNDADSCSCQIISVRFCASTSLFTNWSDWIAAVGNLLSTRAQGHSFLCLGLCLHADCNRSRYHPHS